MNIIKRIVLISISFLIPIIIMLVNLTVYEYNNSVQNYTEQMTQSLNNISAEVEKYIIELKTQVLKSSDNEKFVRLLKNPKNEGYKKEATEIVQNIVNYSENAENVAIISLDGVVLAAYESLPYHFTVDYDRIARERDKQNVLVDFNFFVSGLDIYFVIYAPILSDGEVKGYYIQFQNTDYLESLLSAHMENESDALWIVDSENNAVAPGRFFNLNDDINLGKNNTFVSKYQKSTMWLYDKVYKVKYTSNTDVKQRAIFIVDRSTGLAYVASRSNSAILEESKNVFAIILIYIIVICIFVAVVVKKLSKYLNNTFKELRKTIEIYEMGDWTYRPVIDGEDEMSVIAKALWKLAQNLNKLYVDQKFSEYRYKLAMEFSGDLIYDYNISANVFDADKNKWENLFGFEYIRNEKKIAEEFFKIIHPDDAETFEKYRNQLFQDCYEEIEKQSSIEFRMKLRDGNYHWLEKKDVLVKGVSDNIEHIIGTFVLIDERKNSEMVLTEKATIDSLTSLYNRSAFINNAIEALNKFKSAAVIFVDLDDFKFINDTYGHEAGDDVIRFVGKVISEVVADNGFGGRYGGDEFLAFVNDKKLAEEVASNILERLAKNFTVRGSGCVIKIHSSLGISFYNEHASNIDDLIKRADDAMYYSKKNGKNRYTIFGANKGEHESEPKV